MRYTTRNKRSQSRGGGKEKEENFFFPTPPPHPTHGALFKYLPRSVICLLLVYRHTGMKKEKSAEVLCPSLARYYYSVTVSFFFVSPHLETPFARLNHFISIDLRRNQGLLPHNFHHQVFPFFFPPFFFSPSAEIVSYISPPSAS